MSLSLNDIETIDKIFQIDEELKKTEKNVNEKIKDNKEKWTLLNEKLITSLKDDKYYEVDNSYIKIGNTTSVSYSLQNIHKSLLSLKENHDKWIKGEFNYSKKRKRGENDDDDKDKSDNDIILLIFDHTLRENTCIKKKTIQLVNRVPKHSQPFIVKQDEISTLFNEWKQNKEDIYKLRLEKRNQYNLRQNWLQNNNLFNALKKSDNVITLPYNNGIKKSLIVKEIPKFSMSKNLILDIFKRYVLDHYKSIDNILSVPTDEIMDRIKEGIKIEKSKSPVNIKLTIKSIYPDSDNDNANNDECSDEESED